MGNSIPSSVFRGISNLLSSERSDMTKTRDVMESFEEWVPSPPFMFKPMVFKELCLDNIQQKVSVPEPRSGHRAVCEDGNMYCFGGYSLTKLTMNLPVHLIHGSHRLFQELWCYNFAEDRWKLLPVSGPAPKELASHSAVLDGNYLLVFGGTGVPFGGCSSNQMNICDLRSLEWKTVETEGPVPTPQYGQAVVMDRSTKSFYVIGGTTGFEYSMDIYKLDMTNFVWEAIYISGGRRDMHEPEGRYRHEVAFDGDYIYILGGGTASQAYDLIHVPAFNIHTREWKRLLTNPCPDGPTATNYPTPRKCQESVQLGDEVFVCGGYDGVSIFMDIWKLHLPTMQWTFVPVEMPIPLYFHSTCLTSAGCMYIFGGVTNIKENARTNKVFKIWLKVPSLKEMCWEALLQYNKRLKFAPHSVLLDMGIPKEFVTRVHPAPPCGSSTSEHWLSDISLSKKTKTD